MKWQPIETAPTDGTRILLRGRNGKIADGHYGQPDGFANPKRFVWPYINATPTHWAPLALIAAAAELLAAAMKVNALSIQTDAHKELRAAIANATGDDDLIPTPRGLLGAACYLARKHESPNLLEQLRLYSMAAPQPQPDVQALVEALDTLLRVDDEWHGSVNSEMAEARSAARKALAAYRKSP